MLNQILIKTVVGFLVGLAILNWIPEARAASSSVSRHFQNLYSDEQRILPRVASSILAGSWRVSRLTDRYQSVELSLSSYPRFFEYTSQGVLIQRDYFPRPDSDDESDDSSNENRRPEAREDESSDQEADVASSLSSALVESDPSDESDSESSSDDSEFASIEYHVISHGIWHDQFTHTLHGFVTLQDFSGGESLYSFEFTVHGSRPEAGKLTALSLDPGTNEYVATEENELIFVAASE